MRKFNAICLLVLFSVAGCWVQTYAGGVHQHKKSSHHASKTAHHKSSVDGTRDSIYRSRIKSLPFECELYYNSNVRRYIELYTLRAPEYTGRIIGLGDFYFPVIEKIFESYDIPAELKYVAVLESALNPGVASKNIAGLWQFTRETGLHMGLVINNQVDERRGVVESTVAAARYLDNLYKIYGDWRLVLMAYNCGSSRLNAAIKQAGGKRDYWKIYNHLPVYSRNFLPTFIGIAYAFNFYSEHGITPRPNSLPAAVDTVSISRHLSLQNVAKTMNIDLGMLRGINTHCLRGIIPASETKSYNLYLPSDSKEQFLLLQDSIYAMKLPESVASTSHVSSSARKGLVIHTVRPGENLSQIAKRYKVSVQNIKKWNKLSGTLINPRQRLKIYL